MVTFHKKLTQKSTKMRLFTALQFIVAQGFKFSHFMELVFTESVMTSWTRVRRVTIPYLHSTKDIQTKVIYVCPEWNIRKTRCRCSCYS